MAEEMHSWSELNPDLLVLVGKRLNLIEDYLSFATVCKSWRSVATKENFNSDLPRVPWLMLAEEEHNTSDGNSCRKFYSLYNGMILKKRIPKASGKKCMESMGWLITVGKDEGEISLLHPFSGVHLELPHQYTTKDYQTLNGTAYLWTFFHKAVLSASPSHTSDYVVMVIEGEFKLLSFWRPGDLRWTRINSRYNHRDMVYFSGKFFAVDVKGRVLVYDVADSGPTQIIHKLPYHDVGDEFYIIESMGSLFEVVRYGVKFRPMREEDRDKFLTPIVNDGEIYGTKSFRVFKIDLAAGKLMETNQVGDRAFFIGANASLSVEASQFPGVKPNCVYFTDDIWESYLWFEEGGGMDMGIFNLADGSFEPHYRGVSLSPFCPPTWVTPTLY